MKYQKPRKSARYQRTARIYLDLKCDIAATAEATGLTSDRVAQDIWRARKYGMVPPATQDAERWATETARISDLTVGTRGDLLDALGVDIVKRIAAECPQGVPLMVYIAAIVKDSYDTL